MVQILLVWLSGVVTMCVCGYVFTKRRISVVDGIIPFILLTAGACTLTVWILSLV